MSQWEKVGESEMYNNFDESNKIEKGKQKDREKESIIMHLRFCGKLDNATETINDVISRIKKKNSKRDV